ncbi:MAG TPA: glycosyltransferase family 2 protein [Thiotrichales bacterium]|nr:glycosyltransferase family 2 protein [Thiotrichales bacterium]
MQFSVVMPSRNRPALLRKAIESILAQDHDSFEVLVINDGSDGEAEAEYRAIGSDYGERVRVHDLEKTTRGHGQSYGINIGVELARGKYVTFLDDDDFWTDPYHLSRCQAVIERTDGAADAIYCNQRAIDPNGREVAPVWLDGLLDSPKVSARCIDESLPAYQVTVADLMQHPGFGHLNTSIVRRDLYLEIGGMDDNIRYECDRDFFLRTIDAARTIVHIPLFVSQHHIPDPARRDNMSTVVTDLQKALFQLYLLDKARLFARHPEIRRHGRENKAYALKKITESLADSGRHREAAAYAREALGAGFTMKWLAYTAWLEVLGLVSPSTREERT